MFAFSSIFDTVGGCERFSSVITMAFIRYQQKTSGLYASVYHRRKVNGKRITTIENLGRVLDKDKGIFTSRERGPFVYLPGQEFQPIEDVYGHEESQRLGLICSKEQLILDFGDAYILHEFQQTSAILSLIKTAFPLHTDSILALLFFRILTGLANCHAETWLEGSYTRLLFPTANLRSSNITSLLKILGEEDGQRCFFRNYIQSIHKQEKHGIIIDSTGLSTGLPNSINFPLTAMNSHNGEISNEVRLVVVVDRKTNMPLYFRYIAGNIVDVSTLQTTLAELREFGVQTDFVIIDAGYCSQDNIRALYDYKIPFITRFISNRVLYRKLIHDNIGDITHPKYVHRCNNRLVYIKKVEFEIVGHPCYAYISVDYQKQYTKTCNDLIDVINGKQTPDEVFQKQATNGVFMLISSEDIDENDILPLYYTRQVIEQIFDTGKNNADVLPLRTHSEKTFRGHLMVTFLASILYMQINRELHRKKNSAITAFNTMRNMKSKVFNDTIIPSEPTKKMNSVLETLKLPLPKTLRRQDVGKCT
jgi:hypothetical protein